MTSPPHPMVAREVGGRPESAVPREEISTGQRSRWPGAGRDGRCLSLPSAARALHMDRPGTPVCPPLRPSYQRKVIPPEMTTITDHSGSAAHSDPAALPREGAAHSGTSLGRPTSHGLGGLRLWAGLRTALLAVLLICALPLARVPMIGVAHADAAMTLTPMAGPPSTTATLSGSGFGATEVVTVTFDGALVGAATSSATGGIAALSFIVPNPVAAGAHTVAVRGSFSGQTQSAIFTVTGAPSLALTPSTGNPGATVSLSGGGFGASEPLTVVFDGAQVAVGATTGTGALAGITFNVPNPLAAGAHTSFFGALQEALAGARDYVYVVGWCLTPAMPLDRRGHDAMLQSRLGDLLRATARRAPVRVLLWDGAVALFPPTRGRMEAVRQELETEGGADMQCRLDMTAPLTHCHHQKAIVIDGQVAFVGGWT